MENEYKVIDADNQILLEKFYSSKSEEIKAKYENMNIWNEVDFDCNGDLIVAREYYE